MRGNRFKTVALITVLALLISAFPSFPVLADPSSTLEKIKQAEQEKAETEKKKQETELEKQAKEGQLSELNIKQGDLKVKLDALNVDMTKAADHLTEVEGKIADKEEEIEKTRLEVEEAKQTEEEQYEAMKKRFQASYESPRDTYLAILIGSTSFSAFLNNTDYLNMLADYDTRMLEKYREAKEEVIAREETMEKEKAELDELKSQIEAEQERIGDLISTTNTYVREYQAQINTANQEILAYQADIESKEAQIAAQQENIAALQAQYQRELEMSRAARAAAWRNISEVTFEDGDRYLLANLIYCEAGGEPYEGKLAVGAVVINRVLSSRYPGTISGVIYQSAQFSPVASGRLALALAEDRANAACYEAADQAMRGDSNVGNCLYFRTPLEGMEGQIIGGHIFY
ncbi:MAG: cell wall hydrolase [Lachnospiraceae bacterium]|nr:cell wall hydrolase [Lachnospiraceae bacterium]